MTNPMDMLTSLWGGAGTQGLNNFDMGSLSSSIENMTPAMQEQLGSMDIWSGMGEGAFGTGGTPPSMMNQLWGGLTSPQGGNLLNTGLKGYQALQQNDMMDFQKGLMNKQETRASDAYKRDTEAEDRRRKLRF